MKTTKRFSASKIITYRLSSTTITVYFDTLEEAVEHVKNEKLLHPRSKKFDPFIYDLVGKTETGNRPSFNGLYL